MGTIIRTRIVKVGNSQGIRIPKSLLEQSSTHLVEIEVHGDRVALYVVNTFCTSCRLRSPER